MQVFMVGGAVRDTLMGLPVRDRDFVVVGSTPQTMLNLGFRQVGADFPVFLHPDTGEEYALARTERKTGAGYRGFVCDASEQVTLEEDLGRRDLTINAMAQTLEGHLVDPHCGKLDLERKVLRHVRAASFVEDPVRVLRLARFAARYPDFRVEHDTMALCRTMAQAGELDHLVAERVWQELAKGLMEDKPSRMFEVLLACGALEAILPELARLSGVPQPAAHHPEIDTFKHVMMVLDEAARRQYSLEVRFAALMHDLGKGVTDPAKWPQHMGHEELGEALVAKVCARLKVPGPCRDLARLACVEHTRVHRAEELNAKSFVQLFYRLDAFRKERQLTGLLQVCLCDALGRKGFEDRPYPQVDRVRAALTAAQSVNAGEVAKQCKEARLIPERIHAARVGAVRAALKTV